MKLSDQQINILNALADITIKQKGKNRGQVKLRFDAIKCYDGRTVNSLVDRGLIDYALEGIPGTGYAVTKKGLEVLDSLSD